MCFVRARQDNQVVLTTYGRSSGFCIDPIEKKPLNHFLPGTAVLSFGTAGCNLACDFCQNWDISKSREIRNALRRRHARRDRARRGRARVPVGGLHVQRPVIFMEYAIDVAIACHERGIQTVAVTAGEICDEPRRDFFKHMDAANVDLKAFTQEFYWKICKSDLQTVLDTLVYLKRETKVWFEITTLLIPGTTTPTRSCARCPPGYSRSSGRMYRSTSAHFTRLSHARRAADAARDPAAGPSHRARRGAAVRLRGQYSRRGGQQHVPVPAAGTKIIGRDWYVLTGWASRTTAARA